MKFNPIHYLFQILPLKKLEISFKWNSKLGTPSMNINFPNSTCMNRGMDDVDL